MKNLFFVLSVCCLFSACASYDDVSIGSQEHKVVSEDPHICDYPLALETEVSEFGDCTYVVRVFNQCLRGNAGDYAAEGELACEGETGTACESVWDVERASLQTVIQGYCEAL